MWPKSTFGRVGVVCFWIVSAVAGALSAPRYVEVCKQAGENGYFECTREQAAYFLIGKLAVIAGDFSPFIAAVATAVIAWFTVRLTQATNRQWEATRDAANAAKISADTAAEAFTVLERPYVLPGEISRVTVHHGFRYVTCVIGNYGRTPAIVHRISAHLSTSPRVGENPSDLEAPVKTKSRDYNSGVVLGPGETLPTPFRIDFPAVVKITGDGKMTFEGNPDVFLVMNITFEDIRRTVRRLRVVWKYRREYRRFLRERGTAHSFESEEQPK